MSSSSHNEAVSSLSSTVADLNKTIAIANEANRVFPWEPSNWKIEQFYAIVPRQCFTEGCEAEFYPLSKHKPQLSTWLSGHTTVSSAFEQPTTLTESMLRTGKPLCLECFHRTPDWIPTGSTTQCSYISRRLPSVPERKSGARCEAQVPVHDDWLWCGGKGDEKRVYCSPSHTITSVAKRSGAKASQERRRGIKEQEDATLLMEQARAAVNALNSIGHNSTDSAE